MIYKTVIFGILIFVASVASSIAADATFSWIPNTEPDVTGYEIHYGKGSRNYQDVFDCHKPPVQDGRMKCKVINAPVNTTYYAVVAYDANSNRSDYSNEVSYDPAPSAPNDLQVITVNVNVTVTTGGN